MCTNIFYQIYKPKKSFYIFFEHKPFSSLPSGDIITGTCTGTYRDTAHTDLKSDVKRLFS